MDPPAGGYGVTHPPLAPLAVDPGAAAAAAEAERLRPHVERLKLWLLDEDGFLETLHGFFRQYKDYFDVYSEEHALHYTTLHREFTTKFESEIQGWLTDEGLTEEHLEAMLRLGREGGDPDIEVVIDTMLQVMEYDQWIRNMIELKRRVLARPRRRAR
mmetsp:Transcript_49395/g.87014  ORF Transcript_49395/g.87014 Transcript_49395/m.87014 type:complete len:158 (+) Transcript_49395:17-490(+)